MFRLNLIIPILGIFAIPYLYGGFARDFKGGNARINTPKRMSKLKSSP